MIEEILKLIDAHLKSLKPVERMVFLEELINELEVREEIVFQERYRDVLKKRNKDEV